MNARHLMKHWQQLMGQSAAVHEGETGLQTPGHRFDGSTSQCQAHEMLPKQLLSMGNAAVIGVCLPTRLVWKFGCAVLEPKSTDLQRNEVIRCSPGYFKFVLLKGSNTVPAGKRSWSNV